MPQVSKKSTRFFLGARGEIKTCLQARQNEFHRDLKSGSPKTTRGFPGVPQTTAHEKNAGIEMKGT